jgi:hypothetical protein
MDKSSCPSFLYSHQLLRMDEISIRKVVISYICSLVTKSTILSSILKFKVIERWLRRKYSRLSPISILTLSPNSKRYRMYLLNWSGVSSAATSQYYYRLYVNKENVLVKIILVKVSLLWFPSSSFGDFQVRRYKSHLEKWMSTSTFPGNIMIFGSL